MKRRGVAALFATEYALIGLAAGTIGAIGGGFLSWLVLTQAMEIPWSFYPQHYLGAAVLSAALAVVAGVGASSTALRRRPSDVLRAE